jgi:hypothetical protein
MSLLGDLYWLSGIFVGRFRVPESCTDDVERFMQNLDEGLVDGVPKAQTSAEGHWLESYVLVCDGSILRDGRKFSECIRPGSSIQLVLQLVA